jgi:hypothetical protein
VIEIHTSHDRFSNLWAFVCDCGYELELHTYTVMTTWRRLHAAFHLRAGQQVAA